MENSKKKKKFKFPHTYTLIFCILVIVAVMTYIVPAGNYDTIIDPETGATTPLPRSVTFGIDITL